MTLVRRYRSRHTHARKTTDLLVIRHRLTQHRLPRFLYCYLAASSPSQLLTTSRSLVLQLTYCPVDVWMSTLCHEACAMLFLPSSAQGVSAIVSPLPAQILSSCPMNISHLRVTALLNVKPARSSEYREWSPDGLDYSIRTSHLLTSRVSATTTGPTA
jgi:hypothetical protein